MVMMSLSSYKAPKEEAPAKDTVRELREERHDDVIYAITIKKEAGNVSPDKSLTSEGDRMSGKIATTRHMKGATLDHLVERLTRVFVSDGEDANFLNVFLTTYRTFSTPEEIFNKLYDEYMKLKAEPTPKNQAILRSIVRVVRAWLERYAQEDFQDTNENQLLRRTLALAKIHDEINVTSDDLKQGKKRHLYTGAPLSHIKNGAVAGSGFADFVTAKLVVAEKSRRSGESEKEMFSPLTSPSHCQNPNLDLTSDTSSINSEPAKTLLHSLYFRDIASQLTVIDAKLFHRVLPHHCLSAVSPKNRPATVQATIDQFNRVVYSVVGTVLCTDLKTSQRTKLLVKWIEVAQECRELKNFSSLHAIVSGLQTHALYRLKRAWLAVPQSYMTLFDELKGLNMKDLIMKVGTAKCNTEESSITKVRKDAAMRRNQDMNSGIIRGTVPYLGYFITDLVYLDTAKPDFLEGGFINFEKRRKQFELLAQLHLWQASWKRSQKLDPDASFMEWFRSITILTEEQTFQLSKIIEPTTTVSTPAISSPLKRTISDMFHYNHTDLENGSNHQKHDENIGNKLNHSFNGRIGSTCTPGEQSRVVKLRIIRNNPTPAENRHSLDSVVDASVKREQSDNKILTINSNERTAAVIKKALEAHDLDADTNLKRFSLVQLRNDSNKELQIPDSANVFYAMDSSDQDPTLVLLEEGAEIPKYKRIQHTQAKGNKKKGHRKNNSVSYLAEASERKFTHATSPMRSLYKQLAWSSYNVVTGSYSPFDAARRGSEGHEIPRSSGSTPGEVADTGGVVLLTSRTGLADNEVSSLSEREGEDRPRSTRCYSADFASTVVLPIRVVKPSLATSSTRPRTSSKSAPCSPQASRSSMSSSRGSVTSRDCDIITSTSKLVEWPRYSNTTSSTKSTRSQGWSSRRAIRKTRKPQTKSKFYVQSPTGDEDKDQESPGSKIYFTITSEDDLARDKAPVPMYNTLPARMTPDFSGHDYDEEGSQRPRNLNYRKSQKLDDLSDQEDDKFSAKLNETASISSETSVITEIRLSSFRTPSDDSQHNANRYMLQHPRAPSNHSDTSSLASIGFLSEDVFDDETQQSDSLKHDVLDTTSPGVQNEQKRPPTTLISDQNGNDLSKSPLNLQINRHSHPPKINIECASPISPISPERVRVYTEPKQKRTWKFSDGDSDDTSTYL